MLELNLGPYNHLTESDTRFRISKNGVVKMSIYFMTMNVTIKNRFMHEPQTGCAESRHGVVGLPLNAEILYDNRL